ncbi:SNW domain-containing protein 1 [Trypanosoma conorhini]|uniref:SNW domain-containing protein 1 n=1 Tax=Trypanosoma conorhini TaxID=83891 RepID=A0A422PBM7_9TRYP|nr:SNW domain-containing protein 1 [Trypanosoma conorhini]RNF15106.1 SNW domain-containing protein 1 [Trypanosoma conorhini]
MWGGSEDGGAFAECFYAQYPLGMGRKPPPAVVTGRLVAERAAARPVAAPDTGALVVAVGGGADPRAEAEELAETTEKTKEALEGVLRSRQTPKEDFSGRRIRRAQQTGPLLEIVLPGEVGAAGMHDPAPIVRSPTRPRKDRSNSAEAGSSSSTAAGVAVVPFSIGNWKNKRKLIIPLEQRLAQQADTQANGGGVSDQVMGLAMAMQQARKEVEAEQAAREKARQEEEERRQAEREAEATRRARELLERAASDMLHTSAQRRKETREERLDRIRLERELREREKQQEVRQRRLAKAAARLGITVEALEADEDLLKTVDEAAAGGHGAGVADYASSHPSDPRGGAVAASSRLGADHGAPATDQHAPSLYAADDDETGPRPASGIRKGVFGSAVISNEGIRREMEALAQIEGQQGGVKDGLQLANGEESTDDEDDEDGGGLGMDQLMRKRRRL